MKQPTAMEQSSAKQTSSAGRWFGRSVIYGKEDEANTPFATRYWIGRLRLHIFHRGDQDPDHHDHPWDFWTFPLTSYVEEVVLPVGGVLGGEKHNRFFTITQVVPAFRWSFRPAEHRHRVLGSYSGICWDYELHEEVELGARQVSFAPYVAPLVGFRPVVTIVWRGKERRPWGFLKNRNGKWCWVAWREYVFNGGKNAPCE